MTRTRTRVWRPVSPGRRAARGPWLPRAAPPSGIRLVSGAGAGGVPLTTTAWYGAELVFRHGLGVMSMPNIGVDEASHDTGPARDAAAAQGHHP